MANTSYRLNTVDLSIVDLYFLSRSNSPDMAIRTIAFKGNNFLSWSRSIEMGLSEKLKLGFVDGSIAKPFKSSLDIVRWNKVKYWLKPLKKSRIKSMNKMEYQTVL